MLADRGMGLKDRFRLVRVEQVQWALMM